jgi:DNA-binding NarL/FixJ family response regulator
VNRAQSGGIRVLIIDDNQMRQQLLLRALRRRTELRVAVCRSEMEQILQIVATQNIQVSLLSADRGRNSLDLAMLRRLHITHPEVGKILLIEASERTLVVDAFRSGARGLFCFPDYPFRLLCKCIQGVHRGEIWANNQQLHFLLEALAEVPSLRVIDNNGRKLLTAREEQVVALVADGLSNRDVALELKLSEHTVKKYLFRIFDKLGVSSRVELVLYAMNHGGRLPAEWMAGALPRSAFSA